MAEKGFYSLNDLRQNLEDIARPYMFRLIANKSDDGDVNGGAQGKSLKFLQEHDFRTKLRTAAKPGQTINQVSVNYFGMEWKIAGSPTFNDLTCQIIIDSNYESLKELETSLKGTFAVDKFGQATWHAPKQYMGTLRLEPLGNDWNKKGIYTLYHAYLSQIGDINFDHETKDSPLLVDAQITYSYFTNDYSGGDDEAEG